MYLMAMGQLNGCGEGGPCRGGLGMCGSPWWLDCAGLWMQVQELGSLLSLC